VVRERSQFLFLQLWTLADWKLNARGFLSLVFTAMVITDPRARRLCVCAMVIGAAGLLVGLIASTLGPVAILMQGQAWRWVWLTMFLAILLLPQTVREVWKDPSCGPLCAVLLVGSWTFTPIDPVTGTAVALFLWTVRGHLSDQMGRLLRWAAYAAAAVALAWVVANAWTITAAPSPETGREGALFSHLRNILGLDITAVPIVGLVWFALLRVRSAWVSTAVAAAFAGLAVTALPGAFLQFGLVGAQRQIDEFADWRRLIPPASNVFVIPEHNAATFAWFDLQRPSYISVDQSSGVVFSRSISMEVKRRSEVVLPILDPGWRILSHLEAKHLGKADGDTIRPLTGAKLMAICSDPILDFVVAREDVGFDSQRHVQPGPWKDWHLYDCRRLREGARPA
jgi:MFS family permease